MFIVVTYPSTRVIVFYMGLIAQQNFEKQIECTLRQRSRVILACDKETGLTTLKTKREIKGVSYITFAYVYNNDKVLNNSFRIMENYIKSAFLKPTGELVMSVYNARYVPDRFCFNTVSASGFERSDMYRQMIPNSPCVSKDKYTALIFVIGRRLNINVAYVLYICEKEADAIEVLVIGRFFDNYSNNESFIAIRINAINSIQKEALILNKYDADRSFFTTDPDHFFHPVCVTDTRIVLFISTTLFEFDAVTYDLLFKYLVCSSNEFRVSIFEKVAAVNALPFLCDLLCEMCLWYTFSPCKNTLENLYIQMTFVKSSDNFRPELQN